MNCSIVQNITGITEDPYPHVVACPALPDDLYAELAATRPSPESLLAGRVAGNNLRYDVSARHLLERSDLSPVWREFISYHVSRQFWLDVVRLFGNSIKQLYPQLEAAVGQPLERWSCGGRHGRGGIRPTSECALVQMECQIGLNTPVKKFSAVRGPHVDNPVALFGGLLYMREKDDIETEGSDLLIYRKKNSPLRFYGKAEVRPHCVEEIGSVPYVANCFVGFINSIHSVHGVSPRAETSRYRLLVNFCIDLNFPLFSFEALRDSRREEDFTAHQAPQE